VTTRPGPVLSAQGEEAWLSLLYHVEWAEGFALIFLFSSNVAVKSLLRERLAGILQARGATLETLAPQSASSLVEEVMERIRRPAAVLTEVQAPLWLDLSIALNKVGDVARALGRLEEAEAAYRESLELRRARRQRVGDTPEVMRDLSISLYNAGSVARELGRLDEAIEQYGESLSLRRKLALALPSILEHQKAVESLEQLIDELHQSQTTQK
jgi:tetratricopeptide (TPR) repeat protein